MEAISGETKISRGSVKHHLNILNRRGLITITERKKGEGMIGKPSFINITSKATPIQKKYLDKFEQVFNLFKTK